MIGVDARSMRDYWDVIRSSKCYYSPGLCHTSTPCNIGLEYISTFLLQQSSKSITSILSERRRQDIIDHCTEKNRQSKSYISHLMLSCCYQCSLYGFLQFRVALIVIWWQRFFNPLYIIRLTFSSKLNGVWKC